MFKNLAGFKIVLASNSPRRQQLLQELGVSFEVQSSKGEEVYPPSLSSFKVAEYLAVQKADWFTSFHANELYITADTVVILNNKVLGKPKDAKDAYAILKSLSGNEHQVITGFCLKSKDKLISKSVSTKVLFEVLEDAEIEYYIKKYHPFDKAGSYGIQEWIGMIGISAIEGSYFNVMGLPTQTIFKELNKF
ncbi:MAG: septum formation protein [Salibacteraceae bacterium]|jgi:septum formation protein